MSTKSLTVIAIFKAKPGKEAILKQELLALVPITHKEDGCLNYDLHQDINDPGRFAFHENWTSKAHLDSHLARPHIQALAAKCPDLLAEPLQLILADRIS